jgi:hypothetical protein
MMILTKPKVLKTQRDSKSDKRKPKFQSVLRSLLPVKPVLHTGQISWTYYRASPVHRTCPVPSPSFREVFWICLILDQTCPMNIVTVVI